MERVSKEEAIKMLVAFQKRELQKMSKDQLIKHLCELHEANFKRYHDFELYEKIMLATDMKVCIGE